MTPRTGRSPPLLFAPSDRRVPNGLEYFRLDALRKAARIWLDTDQSKLPREALLPRLREALEDDAAAARALRSLTAQERAVAAAYLRYGGSVNGEVIRLDLIARGLLEIVEKKYSDFHVQRQWRQNTVLGLAERWVLLSEGMDQRYAYSSYGYGSGPDNPLPLYSLHAGIARQLEPAGPAPWSIPPAAGIPEAITRRSPAEVALDLSRIFAYLVARGSVKARKDGSLAGPALRALEKAVPLDDGSEPRLPDPQGLYVDLLRYDGLILEQGSELVPNATAAARRFIGPDLQQIHTWARGWLSAPYWFDGSGTPEGRAALDSAGSVRTSRAVLAWALGCLAHAGGHWYALETFLERLHALQGHHGGFHLPYWKLAWEPKLAAARDQEKSSGEARQRAWWFSKEGAWYANALMVSLVALGLVERARLGRGEAAPLVFRLTESGRAVFGAPEIAPPPEPAERHCLVIQPNYDIVAYLDQAGARTAGFLGRIAESGSGHSGPIQTFRLTQTSVYQAEESGLSHAQIVEFLRQHSQRELPANVLRSLADWSGRRESLSLRSGVTVLAFPTPADRDAYLGRHAGTACGEHFVLGSGSGKDLQLPGSLVSWHLGDRRRTIELDEEGRIRPMQPLDLVQKSRLRRIAQPPRSAAIGWQLTAGSMRQAAAEGLKPAVVHGWLSDHLVRPAPPLIAVAIDAWLRVGRSRPLELADAVLLHVPDKDQFQAIATSRRLRPFLLARPGPGWLVVNKQTRKELAAVLEELGFTMTRELTHDELPAVTKLARADPG